MGKRSKAAAWMAAVLLAMTSCGNSDGENKPENQPQTREVAEALDSEASEGPLSREITPEISKEAPADSPAEAPGEVAVVYEGEGFIKSVFAVGGNVLYICGIKEDGSTFLGRMEAEESTIHEFSIELPSDAPEGMRVFNMTVDGRGSCHMLWMSVGETEINGEKHETLTFDKSYITTVNKEGQPEAVMDVTDILAREKYHPNSFTVDGEGFYLFENKTDIIRLSPDGNTESRYTCDGYVEGIGTGRSGEAYCTYTDEHGNAKLGRLEQNLKVSYVAALSEENAIFSFIAPGNDTELVLYNKSGGVYTYDQQDKTVEQRIQGSDLPVSGEAVSGYGLLGDGRLCLLTQKEGKTIFYYIPVT